MPTALISDIHGNVDALQVVLDDITRRGIDTIYCLGDIIGYGPDPLACIDLVRERCEFSMMGNHDFAVLYEPTSFNTSAEQAAFWTRHQFENEPDDDLRRKRWEFLGNLLIRRWDQGDVFVHASPRRPINEYVFPDDVITAPQKMDAIFDRIEARCFCGHTHVTGVFTDEPDFYPPADLGGAYKFADNEKCIINPGSVGQPRDRDPRSSYAILYNDDEPSEENPKESAPRVEFIRLDYNIDSVVKKVEAIPDLADFLGQRLIEGR